MFLFFKCISTVSTVFFPGFPVVSIGLDISSIAPEPRGLGTPNPTFASAILANMGMVEDT